MNDDSAMHNIDSGARCRLSILTAVAVLGLAACGSDPAASSPTETSTVVAEPTATATTTIDTTTTIAPTTTTLLPTTSIPDAGATGWSDIDPDSLSEKAFPPCCADSWHGDVSPPLAPTGEALADGAYFASMVWSDDPTQPLELELFRFEQCALLAEYSCESPPLGSEFSSNELGVDGSESRLETVELDDGVRVVVVGGGIESDGSFTVIQQGTGTDLAELATAVDQAYAQVFADRFVAGEGPGDIIADVLANPRGGFHPAESVYEGFVFTPEAGPPLLFQMVLPYDAEQDQRVAGRGTDVLPIRSIEVLDGQVTLWVYSAYYS